MNGINRRKIDAKMKARVANRKAYRKPYKRDSAFLRVLTEEKKAVGRIIPHVLDLPEPTPGGTPEDYARKMRVANGEAAEKAKIIVKYSKDINLRRIGLTRHSRGGNIRAHRSRSRSRSIAFSNGGGGGSGGDSDSGDSDQSDPPKPSHNSHFIVKTYPNQIKPNIPILAWQPLEWRCVFERGQVG